MTNVAVVVLDTVRRDAFDRHFEWLPGRRYANAWSPSHWTVPVHGAMFTGLYPSETGVHAKSEPLDVERPVLAERLAAAGYTTRAFSANPYVSPTFGFDRGFEAFTGSWRLRQLDPALFDWTRFIDETAGEGPTRYLRALARCVREDCRTVPSLRYGLRLKLRESDRFGGVADDGAAETLEYLRSTAFGDDEFLYLNLMEAHTPYDPPAAYRTTDVTHGGGLAETITGEGDIDPDPVRQAYDDCIRYLSDVYEEIFAELSESFDYVITCSDHGELLGEHGGWAHGYGLYPELTNVPLVVSGGGVDGTTDDLATLLDVHATVLDVAGLDADGRGRSLLGSGSTEACLTEYHGLTHRRVEKLREADVPPDRVTDADRIRRGIASTDGYGFETPASFQTVEGTAGSLEARLSALVETLDVVDPAEGGDEELSDDVVAQLEDLGYA